MSRSDCGHKLQFFFFMCWLETRCENSVLVLRTGFGSGSPGEIRKRVDMLANAPPSFKWSNWFLREVFKVKVLDKGVVQQSSVLVLAHNRKLKHFKLISELSLLVHVQWVFTNVLDQVGLGLCWTQMSCWNNCTILTDKNMIYLIELLINKSEAVITFPTAETFQPGLWSGAKSSSLRRKHVLCSVSVYLTVL